jgi:hypothetical protein
MITVHSTILPLEYTPPPPVYEFYRLSLDFHGNPVSKVKQLKSDQYRTLLPRIVYFLSLEVHHESVCRAQIKYVMLLAPMMTRKYVTEFLF